MTLSITFYDQIVYHRQDFLNRDSDFYGNGVLYPATNHFNLTYPSTPNMTFNVGQGTAWVDGYRIANDSNVVTLTVPTADTTYPRIDIVQIGHDDINSTFSLVVKKGVAASSPIEPGADTNYIKLYAINVAANATSITGSNVTDRRQVLPLNVNGSQISLAGAAGNGANTFTGTQTAPEFVATSTTAPLQIPNLSSLPTVGPSGTVCMVNYQLYASNGTSWVAQTPSTIPWSEVTGTPTTLAGYGVTSVPWSVLTSVPNIAKYDTAQTWTGIQTWASGQTFAWSALTGIPTDLAKTDVAQTWTATQTFSAAVTLNGAVSGTSVGGNNGLATLDGNGQVPSSQLKNASVGAANPNLWIG